MEYALLIKEINLFSTLGPRINSTSNSHGVRALRAIYIRH